MADINQLMTALRNADAAGDTAAAQRLAALIKQAQGGQTQPKPAAPAPQQRDGALMYGVDRMQQMVGKGIEVAGDLTGIEGVKQYGTDMAAQQEKDIAAGGYQPQYPGSLRENYNSRSGSSRSASMACVWRRCSCNCRFRSYGSRRSCHGDGREDRQL
jgi:hypothetical protein